MEDRQFRLILDRFGRSWEGYRRVRKGVKKRISRAMQEHGFRTVEAYLRALEGSPVLRHEAGLLLGVSISRFFRDRGLWQVLENSLLPSLAARPGKSIQVWSAGCARGEEVYSFKILWERRRRDLGFEREVQVWATDVNPEFLEQAQRGIYAAGSLKELPAEWREAYFQREDGGLFKVAGFLKEGVRWRVHDLLTDDPPGRGFQIIFLRNNLLTYYQEELLRPAFIRVVGSLAPEGVLVVGRRERLPQGFTMLSPGLHPNLYRKIS